MVDTYTIYLVNEEQDIQTFWCFLAPPEQLAADPLVFANSEVSLAVRQRDKALNSFTIPVQYIVGAGASNQAVGLNIEIDSTLSNNASIGDIWQIDYAETVPPKIGPTMATTGGQAPANMIALMSNKFDKEGNEDAGWFANQSFGIETQDGFIGMTWSPDPQKTRTVEPKLTFYVSIGDFGSNALADWTDVSTNAATITAPDNFALGKCTVTYTADGSWSITAGPPPSVALSEDLAWFRSEEHQELMALAQLDTGSIDVDYVSSVRWASADTAVDVGGPALSGTLTVTAALGAAFTYFVLSGTRFEIRRPASGVTTFEFTYSGTKSAQAVKNLLTSGAKIFLGGAK